MRDRERAIPDRERRTQECLSELREHGVNLDSEYSFSIGRERDELNEEIPADAYWLRFPSSLPDEQPVEGKLYLPDTVAKNESVVIFVPGYSGGKAGRFERTYASQITKEGYAFVSLRHNSSALIDQPEPEAVINSEARLADANSDSQTHLGVKKTGGYRHRDLVYEPAVALRALAPNFKSIYALGHSFGSSSWLLSLDKLRREQFPDLDKVKQFLSLAGYLGRAELTESGKLHGMKLSLDDLASAELASVKEDNVDFVRDVEIVKESIRDLAAAMGKSEIPEHITQVLVNSPKDSTIASPVIKIMNEAGREYVSQYDYPGHTKRTLVIEDRTQERKFHSLPGLLPKTMTRLLAIEHPGKIPHFVAVEQKIPKEERSRNQ